MKTAAAPATCGKNLRSSTIGSRDVRNEADANDFDSRSNGVDCQSLVRGRVSLLITVYGGHAINPVVCARVIVFAE